jgi:hypothetical protein
MGIDRLPGPAVIPRASQHYFPFGNYDSHIWVITMHAEPLRKSVHFLHQYMSPFALLPSVLFCKEGLYISMQHHSKLWCGSPFTGSPHHHLVSQSRNKHIFFSSYSFHYTLISTSLFNSLCHMAVWAQIAIPPWRFHSPHLIGARSS